MNRIAAKKAQHLYRLFAYGHGIRESARLAGVNRGTAMRFHRKWMVLRAELQRAYDLLCNGEGEACDEVTNDLDNDAVVSMLECWLDDQDQTIKSGWRAGYEDTPQKAEATAGEDAPTQPRQVQGEPQEA